MANKRETVATGVEGRLDWLRESVKSQPAGAADAAWA